MKPNSREEIFLKAIAEGEECKLDPVTREEMYLAEHAKREASGGSGGSGGEAPLVFHAKLTEQTVDMWNMPNPTSAETVAAVRKAAENKNPTPFVLEYEKDTFNGTVGIVPCVRYFLGEDDWFQINFIMNNFNENPIWVTIEPSGDGFSVMVQSLT